MSTPARWVDVRPPQRNPDHPTCTEAIELRHRCVGECLGGRQQGVEAHATVPEHIVDEARCLLKEAGLECCEGRKPRGVFLGRQNRGCLKPGEHRAAQVVVNARKRHEAIDLRAERRGITEAPFSAACQSGSSGSESSNRNEIEEAISCGVSWRGLAAAVPISGAIQKRRRLQHRFDDERDALAEGIDSTQVEHSHQVGNVGRQERPPKRSPREFADELFCAHFFAGRIARKDRRRCVTASAAAFSAVVWY